MADNKELAWTKPIAMALLRIAIGWHFLYEGVVKLLEPDWTAYGFLVNTTGPLAPFFQGLAADGLLLAVVEQLNIVALVAIGACLMVGCYVRFAAAWGVALLLLYYVAYPPLLSEAAMGLVEGHYLLVNKTLIELLAMCAIWAFPTPSLGLDGLRLASIARAKAKKQDSAPASSEPLELPPDDVLDQSQTRRKLLGACASIPFIGAFGYALYRKRQFISDEERLLADATGPVDVDAITGATRKFAWTRLDDLKGQVPKASIAGVDFSRLILGGNLIGGWAHARDLIYVSKLVKAYHTRMKIFETFRIAEACGVNTILTNPVLCEVINDYWDNGGGKIQFVSDCGGRDVVTMVKKSIDRGATACYIQGATADRLVKEGDFDTIAQCLDLIRDNGLPAGIGGHYLSTIEACVDKGFDPDFWMKTMHHTDYWSAKAEKEKDNIYCRTPEETAAFMESLPQPWIAFKTLAAGAIHPYEGFKYAFDNGADFICVGMYDFQVVDDCNYTMKVLKNVQNRKRPWRA